MFSLCSNFLDFALLSQGQFLVNAGEETEKLDFLKAYSQHTQSPLFSFHSKIGFVRLIGASPKPQKAKAKAKAKMALASLVSSQKQKRTIVKIFLKSDTKKRFFRGGNNRTFIVSLVDTRSVTVVKRQK